MRVLSLIPSTGSGKKRERERLLREISYHFDAIKQVRLCREKTTRHVYAMKKLKKSEMLRRGQVPGQLFLLFFGPLP